MVVRNQSVVVLRARTRRSQGFEGEVAVGLLSLPRRLPRQRHSRVVGVADLHRRGAQRGNQDHLAVTGIDDLMNGVGRDYQR